MHSTPCIPDYAHVVCEICHCFDHGFNSCPCDISNGSFAKLSSMIETMNEQQIQFAKKMREYDLTNETDLRFSSPRLNVNMCDDGASFPPLESELREILDPPLTTLPIVAPSSLSTFRNNTVFIMTFLNRPSPLAQSTEFKIGETFGVHTSVDEDDTCSESGDVFIEVYDLHETPTGTSCVDVVAARPISPNLVDNISTNPLDTFHFSSSCSPPSSSPKCCDMLLIDSHVIRKGNKVDCSESPGTFKGYDPSLDPYSLYLKDLPEKIMLTITFDYSTDFSKAFDKFTRAVAVIPRFMFR